MQTEKHHYSIIRFQYPYGFRKFRQLNLLQATRVLDSRQGYLSHSPFKSNILRWTHVLCRYGLGNANNVFFFSWLGALSTDAVSFLFVWKTWWKTWWRIEKMVMRAHAALSAPAFSLPASTMSLGVAVLFEGLFQRWLSDPFALWPHQLRNNIGSEILKSETLKGRWSLHVPS